MINRIFTLWLILTLLGFTFPANGQDAEKSPPQKRPTVGLVLSGGGARGFAHIGVLKVLEENRIPVDYIGGASMGALVGAMYAMGNSPAEIEQFVGTLDWDKLFQPASSFENLSFRRKEDRRNIPAPVTLKGKINDLKLPNALNSGQEIALLIDRATLPYALVDDFDDLPIPFRAVGTDMVNGVSVPLKSGSLSRSLLATMSIPGVFSPVEVDGKILSDGGLVNNIPTDVVKAMGADILLVVNIETQLGGRESLESLPGVLSQTINIATLDNSRRSLRQADLIVAPDLKDFSLTDFSDYKEIIELGYQGAEQKLPLLKPLALDEQQWQAHLARRRQRQPAEQVPVPAFIDVRGDDLNAARTVREKLADKYTGRPFDETKQNELSRDLLELKGTGRFESLNYSLTARGNQTGLLITINQITEKPSKPTRLELGLDVNSVESDNVNFNFLARLTFYDVGRPGAEWRNDLQLGSNTVLATEYFRPIGNTKFFFSPQASYERRRINFFSDGNRLAEFIGQTFRAGVDLGYSFNPRSELRAGYAIGRQSVKRRIGDPILPNISGRFSVASLRWNYDGLNKAQVPTKGILSRNTLNYFFETPGSDGDFIQAETRFNTFQAVTDKTIVFGFGGAGATFGNSAPLLRKFALGGPFRLGGYGFEELRADNYLLGGAGFLRNPDIFPSFLGGKIYIGAWYEGGSVFESFRKATYRQSFSGGTIIETPFGPVFIGGSVNTGGRGRFYFSYGRFF